MPDKLTRDQALAYWDELHRATSDDLAAVCHPDRSALVNRFFDAMQRRAVSRALRDARVTARGARVLDIGCGRGRWLRYFRQQRAEVVGIDASAAAVGLCQAAGFDVRLESVDRLSVADDSVDIVTSITVLLHVTPESQIEAAHEIGRVCRPGGIVLLIEPTAAIDAPHVWPRPLAGWLELFTGWEVLRCEGHHYTPLLRLFWRLRTGRVPTRLRSAAEDVLVLASWPLELLLMGLKRGQPSNWGLQHVMVLRKPTAGSGDMAVLPAAGLAPRDPGSNMIVGFGSKVARRPSANR